MNEITRSEGLITVGGVETYLVFVRGVELRHFCGFDVYRLEDEAQRLQDTFLRPTADAALASGRDFLLDALTWRAHADYVEALGYSREDGVEEINRMAVGRARAFLERWKAQTPGADTISCYVNGDLGPRGDGYRLDGDVSVDRALGYHRRQVEALAAAGVDVINALTMTNVSESVAIARASSEVGLPCIVSPTVEVDGTTPEGLHLGQFIETVEELTRGSVLYYMVNCAHPEHLEPTLRRASTAGEAWLSRFRGFRANASKKSHQDLDESDSLDRGDPSELAQQIARMVDDFDLCLVGGCCGTDVEHIEEVAKATARDRRSSAA